MRKRKKATGNPYSKLSKMFTRKQINELRAKLIAEHGDKCAICERPRIYFKNNLSIDHSHTTGKIRGLLCFFCNKFRVGRNTLDTAYRTWQYLVKYDPEGG